MRKLTTTIIFTLLLLSPHFRLHVVSADADARVRGLIRAVDDRAGSLTIIPRGDGDAVTLHTNDRTQITRNGERATLGDLHEGDRVTASYDSSSNLAAAIEARGEEGPSLARIEGTIESTGSGNITIVPLTLGPAVTLHVTANTAVTLDGRPARLDDLHRGFTAAASYGPDSLEAIRISAESFAEIRGVIAEVGAGALSIEPSDGGRAVTLNVGPGTPISLNDRPAELGDLHRGFRVVASYVETTLLAIRIAAYGNGEVTGHIRNVDPSTTTVTIAPLVDGPSVTLHILHTTVVTIGGEPASFERLQAGMAAQAAYNLSSFEALSIAARPLDGGDDCTVVRVAGQVAGVDPTTIAIDPNDGGSRLVLNVTDRTEITLNGRPARLSDLQSGMRVAAEFCRQSLVAKSLAARAARR